MFWKMASTIYETVLSFMTWPSAFIAILLLLSLKNFPLMWHVSLWKPLQKFPLLNNKRSFAFSALF